MPRPRFENLAPHRRSRILEIAGQEFARRGYDSASLNQILGAAGVSKGAAYYYFDDKADLFATVVRHCRQSLPQPGAADLSRLDASQFWPAVAAWYLDDLAHLDPWMRGVLRAALRLSQEARVQEPLAAVFGEAQEWLLRLLARGQELGLVRDDLPRDLLLALTLAVDSAGAQWLHEREGRLSQPESKALVGRVLEATRALLRPPTA